MLRALRLMKSAELASNDAIISFSRPPPRISSLISCRVMPQYDTIRGVPDGSRAGRALEVLLYFNARRLGLRITHFPSMLAYYQYTGARHAALERSNEMPMISVGKQAFLVPAAFHFAYTGMHTRRAKHICQPHATPPPYSPAHGKKCR